MSKVHGGGTRFVLVWVLGHSFSILNSRGCLCFSTTDLKLSKKKVLYLNIIFIVVNRNYDILSVQKFFFIMNNKKYKDTETKNVDVLVINSISPTCKLKLA